MPVRVKKGMRPRFFKSVKCPKIGHLIVHSYVWFGRRKLLGITPDTGADMIKTVHRDLKEDSSWDRTSSIHVYLYKYVYIYIDIYGMIESSKSTAIFSTARTEKTMWNNPSICKPRRYLLWGCGIIPISHFKTLVLWVGMNFRSWLNSGIFFLGMSPSWRPRILLRDAQHPMMKGHVLSLVA